MSKQEQTHLHSLMTDVDIMKSAPFQSGVSKLAIDVGNVISQNDTDSGDLASYIASNEHIVPSLECAEACHRLVNHFGTEHVYILSKCKHSMQLATVQLLNRSIHGGGSFLERTGIQPRNVLFCTSKTGGGEGKVRLVPLNSEDKRGPRVAMGNVGKGAVARSCQLTHLIDDRDDCLLSFMLEGHLACQQVQNLDQGALIHFGRHARVPTKERIETFLAKDNVQIGNGKGGVDRAISACQQSWIPAVHEWSDVLETFGLANDDDDEVGKDDT